MPLKAYLEVPLSVEETASTYKIKFPYTDIIKVGAVSVLIEEDTDDKPNSLNK